MEKRIEFTLEEELLRRLDEVAARHGVARDTWIKKTVRQALRSERTRNKVMTIVSDAYMEEDIGFDEMVDLVGVDNAKKIRAVVMGAERSIKEASNA